MIKAVFVDTSAIVALLNRRDSNHIQAKAVLQSFKGLKITLIITNYIRAETHALLLAKAGRSLALQFLENSSFYIAWVSREDEKKAIDILRRYNDKNFSLTDCISFRIMERLGLKEAFAYDHHFKQYGWKIIC